MWYDVNKTLSKNCLFNFVLGPRGCGKTYACKKRAVKNYLKKGEQFIYLRRYDSELDKVKRGLFNDINKNGEFDKHIKLSKSGNYVLGDPDEEDKFKDIIGYPMSLSTASDIKSSSYPDVSLIIFDEFIIDSGVKHYLKNEVETFLDLYETIARMRDVQVLFLSNTISFINPYTLYFDLRLPYGKDWIRRGDLILEMVYDTQFAETKKKTRFGRLIEGTDYANYAIDNAFLRDNNDFIEKKSGNCDCQFIFSYEGVDYGIWTNYQIGKMYVSLDTDPGCNIRYALTLDDHKVNTLLVKGSKSVYLQNFLKCYTMGLVWFENQKVKSATYGAIKKILF